MDLKDKVALVTGGTKGIGAATAMALAEAGAHVAINGRRIDEEAGEVRGKIEAMGRRCVAIGGDMGRPEDVRRCVDETVRQLGEIDVLVHCAGGPVPGKLLEITEETWHRAFDVHVHAAFYLCRAVVPGMKRKKEGAIVLISSVAGIRALRVNVAYQAVKGAIPHLARALAFELADDNIRVNCIAPGIIRTAFHDGMPDEVKKNNLDNRIPLHREGTPPQVASMIREVVTNEYMTGETVVIDGGLTMRIC